MYRWALQGLSELGIRSTQWTEPDLVLETISKGAAGSWQMENRFDNDPGPVRFWFAVDWMRKDLGIVIEEAQRLGTSVGVTEMVDSYESSSSWGWPLGHEQFDNASDKNSLLVVH